MKLLWNNDICFGLLRLLVCQWIFPNSLAWVGGNIELMACFTWELSVRGLDGNSKSIRHLFTNSLAATFMPVCRYMSTIAVENKILISVWSNLIQFIQDGRYYKRFNVAFLPPLCGPELAHSLVLNSNRNWDVEIVQLTNYWKDLTNIKTTWDVASLFVHNSWCSQIPVADVGFVKKITSKISNC